MSRRALASVLVAAAASLGATQPDQSGSTPAEAVAAGCKGRTVMVEVPRSQYPNITRHIQDSWTKGYPRVLRVNRRGADERRERLLSWYERRHQQPKGDGLDLDERPAAFLRASWRASVRPIPKRENRSEGASVGNQLRGVQDGTCVRYDFKG